MQAGHRTCTARHEFRSQASSGGRWCWSGGFRHGSRLGWLLVPGQRLVEVGRWSAMGRGASTRQARGSRSLSLAVAISA